MNIQILKIYPYPKPQDFLGFFTIEKENYEPIIGLDIISMPTKQPRRVCFFYDSSKLNLKYNRLFTDKDLETFARINNELKSELLWFWKHDSFTLGMDIHALNRYYKIMYKIYFQVFSKIETKHKKEFDKEFKGYWEYELAIIKENKDINLKASDPILIECYWWSYWTQFINDGPWNLIHMDTEIDWIKNKIKKLKNRNKYIKRIKTSAKSFEKRIQTFGPCWFQGLDYSPKNSKGENMEFIGQFWTDDVGYYTSKLLYLFYCPKDNVSIQVYDYD